MAGSSEPAARRKKPGSMHFAMLPWWWGCPIVASSLPPSLHTYDITRDTGMIGDREDKLQATNRVKPKRMVF